MTSTTTSVKQKYWSQTDLAEMIGKDRTTIRAYHVKGLRYRQGPRKTNEYPSTASFCWYLGYECSKIQKLDLVGVEPLALYCFDGSLEPYEPTNWIPRFVELGGFMGYDESACLLAAGKINGLVSAGKISSDPYPG